MKEWMEPELKELDVANTEGYTPWGDNPDGQVWYGKQMYSCPCSDEY
jgi:hypothetical protein